VNSFYLQLEQELESLKEQSNLRVDREITNASSNKYITIKNQKLLNLSSNNYLGLANHPQIIKKAKDTLEYFGLGSGSSRVVSGTTSIHKELEYQLAKFQNREDSLLFSSGFCANYGVINAITKRGDLIISDKLNHASIIDGALHSSADFKRYRHCDMNHLEDILKSQKHKRKFIVTDAIFSMDGDFAPLKSICYLKEKYNAILIVDEAHSEGIFGTNGEGLANELKLSDKVDIHIGTFGKAYGVFGAYVSSKKIVIDYIKNRSRAFIYTTAIPPSIAGGILASLELIKSDIGKNLRVNLKENFNYLHKNLRNLGFNILNTNSQITPILIPTNKRVVNFSNYLLKNGIYAVAIKHPTVAKNQERVRVSLMATNTKDEIDYFLKVAKEAYGR